MPRKKMPEWFSPQRGYYIAKYRGKTLEVVRNTDPTDKRRYVAQINGDVLPHPCHTISQAKTKAQKWADTPGFYDVIEPHPPPGETDPVNGHSIGAVIPYVAPDVPNMTGGNVMIAFAITGFMPADSFSASVSNIQAAVDMLRDVGGDVECAIEPPDKVKL
jgi:hypothetical protein